MTTITVTDLQQQFTDVGNRVSQEGERIIVTRKGKLLFAVRPCEAVDKSFTIQENRLSR